MQNVLDRVVVDGSDEAEWLAARVGKIGGSDAAGFAKIESAHLYLKSKLHSPFYGNAYTQHGKARERRMLEAFHFEQNFALFHAADNPRHVCTPDGFIVAASGEVILAQAKTVLQHTKELPDGTVRIIPAFTNAKGERAIPPTYKRQMWWEQYVMGARRTLFLWEEHDEQVPLNMEPESLVFERDDVEVEKLIIIADLVLLGMDQAELFRKEIQS